MATGSVHITEVGDEHLQRVAQACELAFGTPKADYFERSMRLDPDAEHAITLVAEEDGEIACTLRIFSRQIRWQGRSLRMGGIGNVATHPDHRGKGHASALMAKSIEMMEQRGFQISLLFTDLPRVYEKSGYAVWERSEWAPDLSSVNSLAISGLTVRKIDRTDDLPDLMALHSAFNAPHCGTLIREKRHWLAMWEMFPTDDAFSLVACDGTSLVGHLRAMREGDTLRVHEVSATEIEPMALLLSRAAATARAEGLALRMTLPAWPPIPAAIELAFPSPGRQTAMAGMWRPLGGGPAREEIDREAAANLLHYWTGDRF